MIEQLQFWLKMEKVGNTECMSVSQQHPAALLQILQDIAVFGAKKGQFLFWKKASIYKCSRWARLPFLIFIEQTRHFSNVKLARISPSIGNRIQKDCLYLGHCMLFLKNSEIGV